MAKALPEQVRVVVIGGGIMGCSVAYHLTQLGWTDVAVLEQFQLTAGTTWHAAGLVGQLRTSENLTRLARYAIDLYPKLEDETGQATGYKQNGALTVAQTPARFHELKRHAAMAARFDVECHVITPSEVADKYPLAKTDDIEGAIWLPHDGQTNPIDTTQALAKGARLRGASIHEGVKVRKILARNGRAVGVDTDQGRIAAEIVVLCGGLWSRDLAAEVGVAVPLHAAEHMYIVTEAMDQVPAGLPVLRDYDACIYIKEDAGKILLGGFEPVAKPYGHDGLADDHAFMVLPDDWDQFEILMEGGLNRIPALETAGIRQFMNGPESFTPDNGYMLGEAPELANLYVGCGFNSIGIASSPGAGKALAEWIVGGEAPMDLWDVDVRRFQPFQAGRAFLKDRVTEALGNLYAMHWPLKQWKTARGARRLPAHARIAGLGAAFGQAAGWERPLWYEGEGATPEPAYSYGRQAWWPHTAREVKATREAAALYELTPFVKFEMQGPDAETVLQRLCANDVAVEPGRLVYTQLLNAKGGIEADLTVSRQGEDRFWIITGSAVGRHDEHWIRRNIPDGARVTMTEFTNRKAVYGVMGPQAREVLGALTSADLSNEAFPFGTWQDIEVGYVPVKAMRVSFVGELGWELHVDTDFAGYLFDLLVDRGGLVPAGLQAMDACRLEKAFKHWGHDIGPEDTPLEAGLRFAVAWDKNADFIGRDALLKQRERPLTRRLVTFTLDPTDDGPLLLHEEPIYRDGTLVGGVTSGGYSFTLDKAMALGWVSHDAGVDRAFLDSGRFEIDIAGERHPAAAKLGALWDPKSVRMKD